MSGVSESVLDALARALQLDDAERAHLFDLARAAQPTARAAASAPGQAAHPARGPVDARRDHRRRRVRAATSASTSSPPTSSDARCSPSCTPRPRGRSTTPASSSSIPRAEAFYADWDRAATESVAILRSAAGRDPYDRDLSDLVGELATQSEDFRTRWAAHNVRFHHTGVKHFNHPVVGELHLTFNRLDLAADPGLTIFTYAAEPGSRSEEALNLLGSWAATVDPAESARATDPS